MDGYSDSKFGTIFRHWFGLTAKHGGCGDILTFNETEATKVTRFYPKGPIRILKMGIYTAATLGKGEEAFQLQKSGTKIVSVTASTTSAPYAIASSNFDTTVPAGSYLTLIASTNVCSTGSTAVFFDYIPKFSNDGKWDGKKHSA